MDLKKIRKNLSYFFGWLGLSLCSLVIKVIPGRYLYAFAKGIGSLGYHLAAKQRKIALESLSIAFGKDKSPEEIERIAKDCFAYMSKSAVELIFLMDRPQLLKKRVYFEGRENLDNALSKNQGVILVSAHFGSFPLLMAKLGLEGYKISGIMRPMKDDRVEKLFLAKRKKLNVLTIYSQPRQACVNQTIDLLRNNGIVFIPIDQNFGTAGVFVDFFGTKAATATGPIVFAQRTKAAIIPCFIVRENDDRHKIIFESPLDIIPAKDAEETIRVNIQRLTGIIELYIRKYPAQWGWVHRRWKSRPVS